MLFSVFYAISPSLAPLPVKFCARPNDQSHGSWATWMGLGPGPSSLPWKAALPEGAVQTPEHSALGGPWLCPESHPPRAEQLYISLSTCWPKGDKRDDETSLKLRQGSAGKTAAVATLSPRLPRWGHPLDGGARRGQGKWQRQLRGQTLTPKSTHASESAGRKDQRTAFIWGSGLHTVVTGERKRKQRRQQADEHRGSRPPGPGPAGSWPPAALLAFLLGLTMILTWPQIKERNKRQRERKRKGRKGKENDSTWTFKDTDYLNEERRSRERRGFFLTANNNQSSDTAWGLIQ